MLTQASTQIKIYHKHSQIRSSSFHLWILRLTFVASILPTAHSAQVLPGSDTFSPRSGPELVTAVNKCLENSPRGACSWGLVMIQDWDVSAVTDMSSLFADAQSFNTDISNWDVSNVTSMHSMFSGATSFNVDISKWDVSRVTDMTEMFSRAHAFNADISKWDVSGVLAMQAMFSRARSFNQKLCGAAWVYSRASKRYMFSGSEGSISTAVCGRAITTTTTLATTTHETPAAITTSTIAARLSMCPKCGKKKDSGKLSCCIRGGAWFQNCGDPGDPNFDHTWFEGVQACKGMFIARLM